MTAAVLSSLFSAIGAFAQPDSRHSTLRHYVASITPKIHDYRELAERAYDVLAEPPSDDVGPQVAALSAISGDFTKLAASWNRVKAPPGLRSKHRGMGGAFLLQARAFSAWAQGTASRDLGVLAAASAHAKELLGSAAYLQKRWAAALSGAMIRAFLPVPVWLQGMATLQLP